MTTTAPLKKLPSMKKWVAQANPPKNPVRLKKMNDRLLLPLFK